MLFIPFVSYLVHQKVNPKKHIITFMPDSTYTVIRGFSLETLAAQLNAILEKEGVFDARPAYTRYDRDKKQFEMLVKIYFTRTMSEEEVAMILGKK